MMRKISFLLTVSIAFIVGCAHIDRIEQGAIPKSMTYKPEENIGELPQDVKNTWKAVKLEIVNKANRKTKQYNLPIHSEFRVPKTELLIHVGDIFPTLLKTEKLITTSNEPRNPAVYLNIYSDGTLQYSGFMFANFPKVHPFISEKYEIRLVKGIKK